MSNVAFLTASCMLTGHPDARDDAHEFELEFAPMRAACAAVGIAFEAVVWDDDSLAIDRFDAYVIGTTWDYWSQAERFLQRLDQIASVRPLFNAPDVVRWNLDKRYLRDLEAKGVATVPTLWPELATPAAIAAAFDAFGADSVVVKPQVGAGAWRQARIARGAALPPADELPPGPAMIQPFLSSAATEGEYSYLFFGGQFSHCVQKIPQSGDYRVQSIFGASERAHIPTAAELDIAHGVLRAADCDPLYARVDLMRGDGGGDERLLLMEVELVEPYLYPEQGPGMGAAFAAALQQRLRGRRVCG